MAKVSKRAFITGINGQDGSYLAELLLAKKYKVFGFTQPNTNIKNVPAKAEVFYGNLKDAESVIIALKKAKPDEVYNFAGISDLKTAFQFPEETIEINYKCVGRLLDESFKINPDVRFIQASSSEIFIPSKKPLNENSARNWETDNPYAKAKMMADRDFVDGYRKLKNVFVCSAILFNHESPRRPERFVTRKITSTLVKIKSGFVDHLELGNLDALRDWGFAGDYVAAMWLMLQNEKPEDFVIATGQLHSIREFIETACKILSIKLFWQGKKINSEGLDDKGKVIIRINPDFYRANEKFPRAGDNTKARKILKWKPKTSFDKLVKMMVEEDLGSLIAVGNNFEFGTGYNKLAALFEIF